MFEVLRSYINKINERVVKEEAGEISRLETPSGPCNYIMAVNTTGTINDFSQIINEIRSAIKSNMIKRYSELETENIYYYIIRLAVDGNDEHNIPSEVKVLYKEEDDQDVIWIFGFTYGSVITIEYDVNTDNGTRYHRDTYTVYDIKDDKNGFHRSMTEFFKSIDLEIM